MGALLGTLRSNNGDVHANVAEKQTSHHFKLSRDYPISSCYLKEGERAQVRTADGRVYRLTVPLLK